MESWNSNVLTVGTTRRSFSMLRQFAGIASADKPFHLFKGVELNTLALTITPDAIVTGTFGAIGQGLATAATAPTGATFPAVGTTEVMDAFSGSNTEGGATIALVTEITLNLENGLEPRFVVGSDETLKPSSAKSNVTGQITAYFENSRLLDKFIDETASSLTFQIQDPSANSYTFTLPNIKYTGGQPDVSGEGTITLSMPFQALCDYAE